MSLPPLVPPHPAPPPSIFGVDERLELVQLARDLAAPDPAQPKRGFFAVLGDHPFLDRLRALPEALREGEGLLEWVLCLGKAPQLIQHHATPGAVQEGLGVEQARSFLESLRDFARLALPLLEREEPRIRESRSRAQAFNGALAPGWRHLERLGGFPEAPALDASFLEGVHPAGCLSFRKGGRRYLVFGIERKVERQLTWRSGTVLWTLQGLAEELLERAEEGDGGTRRALAGALLLRVFDALGLEEEAARRLRLAEATPLPRLLARWKALEEARGKGLSLREAMRFMAEGC